jgi:hypothetical protein
VLSRLGSSARADVLFFLFKPNKTPKKENIAARDPISEADDTRENFAFFCNAPYY